MNSIVTGNVVKGSDCFIVDWFGFSVRVFDLIGSNDTLEAINFVIRLLGFPTGLNAVPWEDMPYGLRFYRKRMEFGGIKICYDACINSKSGNQLDNEDTIYIEMSGQGCRTFETYSKHKSFLKLFELCVNDCEHYHCSRLDIAFDDWSGALDLDAVAAYSLSQYVVTPFRSSEVTKAALFSGNHQPQTVYYGSRTSDIRLRFYNKAAERQRDDVEHWIRCEAQLRDDRAYAAIQNIVDFKDVSVVMLGLLNEYLRFVEPCADSNKSRWSVAAWWAAFLDNVGKIKLITQKTIQYNYLNVKNYVYQNCARAIKTIIGIDGGDQLLRELRRAADPMDIPKYRNVINEMNYYKHCFGGNVVDVASDCFETSCV
jgi:Putative phage replication protein RstA